MQPTTEITNKSSAVGEMGDCGHNRHGPREAAVNHFAGEELRPCLTQCVLGRGLLPYQVASSSIQPFGHNRHGPKTWGCATLGEGGARCPSNTMWPRSRPTCKPSFILIHATVWSQYTDVKDRQTDSRQTDRQTGEEWTDSTA